MARTRADRTHVRTRLAELRLASGLGQREVADAAGISETMYVRLERGLYGDDPPLRALVNVSIVLTGDPTALLDDYLIWHPFDQRHAEPPKPNSLAPGVPPQQRQTAAGDPDRLTSAQRDLLAKLADAHTDPRGGDIEIDRTGALLSVHVARTDKAGRRRRYLLGHPPDEDVQALIDAGLVGARTVALTPSGELYAERKLRTRR